MEIQNNGGHFKQYSMSFTQNGNGPGTAETSLLDPAGWESTMAAGKLSILGPDGKSVPFITGQETHAELRTLALWFITDCPAHLQHPRCPFRVLSRLYQGSFITLLNGMTRSALLSLFEHEFEIRNCHPVPGAQDHFEACGYAHNQNGKPGLKEINL